MREKDTEQPGDGGPGDAGLGPPPRRAPACSPPFLSPPGVTQGPPLAQTLEMAGGAPGLHIQKLPLHNKLCLGTKGLRTAELQAGLGGAVGTHRGGGSGSGAGGCPHHSTAQRGFVESVPLPGGTPDTARKLGPWGCPRDTEFASVRNKTVRTQAVDHMGPPLSRDTSCPHSLPSSPVLPPARTYRRVRVLTAAVGEGGN